MISAILTHSSLRAIGLAILLVLLLTQYAYRRTKHWVRTTERQRDVEERLRGEEAPSEAPSEAQGPTGAGPGQGEAEPAQRAEPPNPFGDGRD